MLDQHAGVNGPCHKKQAGGDEGHDEGGSLGAEAAVAFALRGKDDPDAGPADRPHDESRGQIRHADHQTAEAQFHFRAARQLDTDAVEFADRQRQPDQQNAEHKTPAAHFFREQAFPRRSSRGGFQGKAFKVRGKVVPAFAILRRIGVCQEAAGTFKRNGFAHLGSASW